MPRAHRLLALFLVGGSLLQAVPLAQTPIVRKDSYGRRVRAVDFAGDVNADGWPDFIVGMPHANLGGINAGAAEVISGADGSLLRQSLGDEPDDYWGYQVSGLGDLNGDGHDDYAAASFEANHDRGLVRIFSGIDGSLLREYAPTTGGNSARNAPVAAGNLNSDGFADYLMSADLTTPFTHAFSGVDGTELYTVPHLGELASIGDVDGDSVPDFVVGQEQDSDNGYDAGAVFVYSGAAGAYLFRVNGFAPYDEFGGAVDAAGDVNGDGTPDFVAGATQFYGSSVGYVLVCSGKDGQLLHRFNGEGSPDRLGCSVAGLGDVDGDGVPDILAGSRGFLSTGSDQNRGGYVKVFSGASGALLGMVRGVSYEERFGDTAAGGVDLNRNGVPDFLVGGEYSDYGGDGFGSAFVYDGTPSTAPILEVTRLPDPGDRLFVGMNAVPAALCFVLFAPDPGVVDLPWLGLTLDIGPDPGSIALLLSAEADDLGTLGATFPTPADSVLSGMDFYLQSLTLESGIGFRKSNAARTVFN